MQQPVPGSSGRQNGTSSSEFSELENKEALKRPAAKKGGPVLRRVQSKCHESPPVFWSHSPPAIQLDELRAHAMRLLCIAFN